MELLVQKDMLMKLLNDRCFQPNHNDCDIKGLKRMYHCTNSSADFCRYDSGKLSHSKTLFFSTTFVLQTARAGYIIILYISFASQKVSVCHSINHFICAATSADVRITSCI